ncbi:hypothetical protein TTHERM_01122820 (macronuclear) [Tetrahymena thermophila SB210]|uniref:Uncharacterized protein n=1 Tax=Tetrahymena thermophila (strain SB210) TaxID=312017 RepID=Q23S10_TETTS|nr:hypothetical protein TTHERM_01122820 [Tetrahymena thermophila SB210]EAR99337.2 hypothetical protein TTHERM_01122820 [Tetrahymena thermophila SB210]|eukprot:XP_001019582.2 hypothetical protein TTHERM_01122820 [Tetrahymena thermophila SB210]
MQCFQQLRKRNQKRKITKGDTQLSKHDKNNKTFVFFKKEIAMVKETDLLQHGKSHSSVYHSKAISKHQPQVTIILRGEFRQIKQIQVDTKMNGGDGQGGIQIKVDLLNDPKNTSTVVNDIIPHLSEDENIEFKDEEEEEYEEEEEQEQDCVLTTSSRSVVQDIANTSSNMQSQISQEQVTIDKFILQHPVLIATRVVNLYPKEIFLNTWQKYIKQERIEEKMGIETINVLSTFAQKNPTLLNSEVIENLERINAQTQPINLCNQVENWWELLGYGLKIYKKSSSQKNERNYGRKPMISDNVLGYIYAYFCIHDLLKPLNTSRSLIPGNIFRTFAQQLGFHIPNNHKYISDLKARMLYLYEKRLIRKDKKLCLQKNLMPVERGGGGILIKDIGIASPSSAQPELIKKEDENSSCEDEVEKNLVLQFR